MGIHGQIWPWTRLPPARLYRHGGMGTWEARHAACGSHSMLRGRSCCAAAARHTFGVGASTGGGRLGPLGRLLCALSCLLGRAPSFPAGRRQAKDPCPSRGRRRLGRGTALAAQAGQPAAEVRVQLAAALVRAQRAERGGQRGQQHVQVLLLGGRGRVRGRVGFRGAAWAATRPGAGHGRRKDEHLYGMRGKKGGHVTDRIGQAKAGQPRLGCRAQHGEARRCEAGRGGRGTLLPAASSTLERRSRESVLAGTQPAAASRGTAWPGSSSSMAASMRDTTLRYSSGQEAGSVYCQHGRTRCGTAVAATEKTALYCYALPRRSRDDCDVRVPPHASRHRRTDACERDAGGLAWVRAWLRTWLHPHASPAPCTPQPGASPARSRRGPQ
jgi:hypothetical protein